MWKLTAILLVLGLGLSVPAAAQEPDVEYVNGTVQGCKDGTTGTLDMSSPQSLEFRSGSSRFSIPYAEITSVKYREENRFRLGVLPAIAVGLLKARSKRHFVSIAWRHDDDSSEVVTLDASREKTRGLMAVLRVRAPRACPPHPGQACGFAD
jgi:hypothetical protein